jgi:hypothetical protein
MLVRLLDMPRVGGPKNASGIAPVAGRRHYPPPADESAQARPPRAICRAVATYASQAGWRGLPRPKGGQDKISAGARACDTENWDRLETLSSRLNFRWRFQYA